MASSLAPRPGRVAVIMIVLDVIVIAVVILVVLAVINEERR